MRYNLFHLINLNVKDGVYFSVFESTNESLEIRKNNLERLWNKKGRSQFLKSNISILSNEVSVFKWSKSAKFSIGGISKEKSQRFNIHLSSVLCLHNTVFKYKITRMILKMLLAIIWLPRRGESWPKPWRKHQAEAGVQCPKP